MEGYAGVKFPVAPSAQVPRRPGAAGIADIVKQARRIADAGLAPSNAGNLSVRTGSGFLITAAGSELASITAEDVSEVFAFDFEKYGLLRYAGALPSSETALHYLIYARRGCGAIAHCHDELLIKPSIAKKLHIPITKNELPYGTKELALETARALGHGSIVAMRNHGVVSLAKTLAKAVEQILALHEKAVLP